LRQLSSQSPNLDILDILDIRDIQGLLVLLQIRGNLGICSPFVVE